MGDKVLVTTVRYAIEHKSVKNMFGFSKFNRPSAEMSMKENCILLTSKPA